MLDSFTYLVSISRTSGIGDHGPNGLQDFVTSHVCNYICTGLRLVSSALLQNTLDGLLLGAKDWAPGISSVEEEEAAE